MEVCVCMCVRTLTFVLQVLRVQSEGVRESVLPFWKESGPSFLSFILQLMSLISRVLNTQQESAHCHIRSRVERVQTLHKSLLQLFCL